AGGSAKALSSRSCSDFRNSASMPARFAASLIFTMKNKSSTTARIFRGDWAIHHNPVFLFQAFDAHRRKLPLVQTVRGISCRGGIFIVRIPRHECKREGATWGAGGGDGWREGASNGEARIATLSYWAGGAGHRKIVIGAVQRLRREGRGRAEGGAYGPVTGSGDVASPQYDAGRGGGRGG